MSTPKKLSQESYKHCHTVCRRPARYGSTLSETDFCKIMEFLADYLKMIKLYEKIMCDFHFFYEKAKKHSANLWLHMVLNDEDFERVAKE